MANNIHTQHKNSTLIGISLSLRPWSSLLGSSVLDHKQPSLNALHDDGPTLEVRVAGPGTLEPRGVAVRGHVKVPHLLQFRFIIFDVGDVYDTQASTIVGFVGEVTPVCVCEFVFVVCIREKESVCERVCVREFVFVVYMCVCVRESV